MDGNERVILDLDALVGGEVWAKLDGKLEQFFADFCSADETHYQLIQARWYRHMTRLLAHSKVKRDHLIAVAAAEEAGKAPPAEPAEMNQPFDENDSAFYGNYERDLFGLFTRVWRASEASKPEPERVVIDEDYVRRKCSREQVEAVISRLWQSRHEPRVSVPAPDLTPAETPTKASAPRRRGRERS